MKIARIALLAALVAAFPAAQAKTVVPPLPARAPGSLAVLLGVESVRKELHLTSLQRAVLNDIRNEYREDSRAVVKKALSGALSKKEAQSRIDSLTVSSDRQALRSLNASQRQRLAEIQHQVLGAYMLLSADVQKTLALTPKQKSKIAYVWWRGELNASKINKEFEEGSISNYERLLELRENRLDRADDMLERLTKAQRATLDRLAGEKFNG